jgi:hypothetical protein
MLEFFILFVLIGIIQNNFDSAIGPIIIISVLWLFIFGVWAIATFIELLLGYSLARKIL